MSSSRLTSAPFLSRCFMSHSRVFCEIYQRMLLSLVSHVTPCLWNTRLIMSANRGIVSPVSRSSSRSNLIASTFFGLRTRPRRTQISVQSDSNVASSGIGGLEPMNISFTACAAMLACWLIVSLSAIWQPPNDFHIIARVVG